MLIAVLLQKREKKTLSYYLLKLLSYYNNFHFAYKPLQYYRAKSCLHPCTPGYITLSVHSSSNFLTRIQFFCTFALWAEKIAKAHCVAVSKYWSICACVCVSCSWQITACSPVLKYCPQIERTTVEDKCDIRQAV